MWKRLVPLVVVVVVITGGVQLYKYRNVLFRPDFTRTGGTLFVVEAKEPLDEDTSDNVIAAFRRRFDPADKLGIQVEATGERRFEIRIPQASGHTDRVEQVRRLLDRPGRCQLVMAANMYDDGEVFRSAMAALAAPRAAALNPPPPPRDSRGGREFVSAVTGEPRRTYRWGLLTPPAVEDLRLDSASLTRENPTDVPHIADSLKTGKAFAPTMANECLVTVRQPDPKSDPLFYLLLRDSSDEETVGNEQIDRAWWVHERYYPFPMITVRPTRDGGDRLFRLTSRAQRGSLRGGTALCVLVDGQVYAAILHTVPTRTELQFQSRRADRDADDLTALLRGLPLPVPLALIEEREIAPR
ncbi:MAG: hypothetical protein U0840_12795 [Gemmataceae bacterium]